MRINAIIFWIALLCVAAGCSSKSKTEPTTSPRSVANGAGAPAVAAAPAATATQPSTTAAVAAPATKAAPVPGSVECVRDADHRMIEVVGAKPVGCSVFYTKEKSREAIASSAKGDAHCKSVQEKIKANLETAGYKCAATVAADKTADARVPSGK